MDSKQVFVKTQIGDEAVRQSTRVVQRNLRMVLVQVDGKLSVKELSAKIGNPRLVEAALRELEEGGFVVPKSGGAVLGRTESRPAAVPDERVSAISQFSTFGTRSPSAKSLSGNIDPASRASQFSSFGKPILPMANQQSQFSPPAEKKAERKRVDETSPENLTGSRWRWVLGVPLGLLLVLLVIVLFYPYDNLKPKLEDAASRMLQIPVRIASVNVAILPRPALVLSGLKLGEAGEGAVDQVRLGSPINLLGSGRHVLSVVDVVGATVPVDLLMSASISKPSALAATDSNLLLGDLRFDRLSITVRDLALRDLAGVLSFKNDGILEKASFENTDLGLRLQAMPAEQGIMLDIEGFGWKPFGPSLRFDLLQAKGLLQKGKLVIHSVDTTFLNGVLKGSWMLDWSKGTLSMAGDATLMRLDSRKIASALVPSLMLEGELAGSLRLRGNGGDWDALWNASEVHLDVDIVRGAIHGFDLGEVVRRGAGYVGRTGTTKFEHLRSVLTIDSRQVVGRDLQMSAGMLTASGQFVEPRGQALDANLMVTMQTSVSTVKTPVHIGGQLSGLIAATAK